MAGTFTDTSMSVGGCDSIATICIIMNDTNLTIVMDSLCPSETAMVGAGTFTAPDTITDVFNNTGGCDSTVVTILKLRTDSLCNDTAADGDCGAIVVSDSNWRESTVVTPTNLSGNWNGVNGNLPPSSSYTVPGARGPALQLPHHRPTGFRQGAEGGQQHPLLPPRVRIAKR